MKRLFLACTLGLVLAASLGCGDSGKGVPGEEAEVVAEVNGWKISQPELAEQIARVSPGSRIDPGTLQGRKEVLDVLINRRLLLQEAEKAGIPDLPAVKEQIKQQREALLLDLLIQSKFGAQLDVSDAEIASYYGQNVENLVAPETRRIRQLVVATEKEAQEMRGELLESEEFGKLAQEHSLEPFRFQGGDLGYIAKSDVVPEFAEAAFSLPTGTYSSPVKTQFGFHIIEVLDIRPERRLSLAESRDAIRSFLAARKRDVLLNSWVNDLKAAADIKVYGGRLAAPPPALGVAETAVSAAPAAGPGR